MNITKENTDELNAVLKIKIGPEDYQAKIDSALKDYQKKVNMPGFRPGKVPAGMIKKMYGKSILAEELNKLLSDSLYKYISENNLEVLGNPLPKEDGVQEMNIEAQKEFEFLYDLGLAPKFNVNISDKDKHVYYTVIIDDSLIDKYVEEVCRRYGSVTQPEASEDKDMLFGDFVELDDSGNILPGGIFKSSSLFLEKIKNEELKKLLIGLKIEDKTQLDLVKLTENAAELATLLSIEIEKAETLTSQFQFTVKGISRLKVAEQNQELFDKVYGVGKVNSQEEFRNKIKEELESMYAKESDAKFKADIVKALLDKLNISLPDEFLKRWMMAVSKEPVTYEQINAEYTHYSDGLKWQLIENKILKDNQISVSKEEVTEYVKKNIREQYARYMKDASIEEAELETIAKRVFEKEEEIKKIYDQLYNSKIMHLFKTKFTIEEKKVNSDEFFSMGQ